jgi:hypothetical protein
MGSSVSSVGGAIELGKIHETGLYISGESNGGYSYAGYWFNIGFCLNNKDSSVKNVFGGKAGFSGVGPSLQGDYYETANAYFYDYESKNFSFGGVFWKLMFGKNGHLDITNKFLLGYKSNPIEYNINSYQFVYKNGLNMTYIGGIGYTLTKAKKQKGGQEQ